MAKLIYCATPSRLMNKTEDVMNFISDEKNAPMHPFQAFPYDKFEGSNDIGREQSMRWCMKLVDICDEFYLFGVSEGTLQELKYAIKIGKPIKLKLDVFDKEWKKFYEELKDEYRDILKEFLINQDIAN